MTDNRLFEANFTTDISFEKYCSLEYSYIHEKIMETKINDCLMNYWCEVCFYPVRCFDWFSEMFKNSKELTYLIFMTFYCEKPLYLVGCLFVDPFRKKPIGEGGRLEIVDTNYIDDLAKEDIYEDNNVIGGVGRIYFLTNYLANVRKFFVGLSVDHKFLLKQKTQSTIISTFVNDVLSIKDIGSEFHNCLLTISMKNGNPTNMNATTKSQNTDFNYWKSRLGDYRKIEENTNNGKTASLKLTKKYKYGE